MSSLSVGYIVGGLKEGCIVVVVTIYSCCGSGGCSSSGHVIERVNCVGRCLLGLGYLLCCHGSIRGAMVADGSAVTLVSVCHVVGKS